jgi:hypothetical protein
MLLMLYYRDERAKNVGLRESIDEELAKELPVPWPCA